MRADIQAVRAAAVLGVVVYHVWPTRLPGGFAGVDVFFVISGFLITGKLDAELERTGRVKLTAFWARRIRRLLPAAFTVLAACAAFLFLAMPRLAWAGNLDQIRGSALYVENWQLAHQAVDYLAAEHTPSLVQHYWSLSVEEQFYVLWPLLCLAAFVVGRQRRRTLVVTLAVAVAASLYVSVRWTAADAAYAFFATPTRAWEFAAGGLVAVAAKGRSLPRAVGDLGLAGIVASFFAISSGDAFPGWVAALPVAATALVLAADAAYPRRHPVNWAPVQWTGDVSYALYLWHWPVLIGVPWVLHHRLTALDRWAILCIALAAAEVTRRFVENPVRRRLRRRWPAYLLASGGVLAFAAVTTLTGTRVRHDEAIDAAHARRVLQAEESAALAAPSGRGRGPAAAGHVRAPLGPVSCFGAGAIVNESRCPDAFARPAHLDTAFAAQDGPTYQCLQDRGVPTPQWCTFGDVKHSTTTLAIIGNSHARRLVPALDLYGRQHHWKILAATEIDCMGLSTSPVPGQPAGDGCVAWSAAVQRRLLTTPGLTGVIFASHVDAALYLAGPSAAPSAVAAAESHVLASWRALRAKGVRVLVTGDVPGMRPDNDPDCLAQSTERNDPCSVDRRSVVKGNLLTRLAQLHPDLVTYVGLTRYFCDARSCHAIIGGVVVYFDSHHLTDTYSRSLAPYLGPRIAAALH